MFVPWLTTVAQCDVHTIGLIKQVDSFQKVFTKKLTGMRYLSYEQQPLVINLESLEVRRLKTKD